MAYKINKDIEIDGDKPVPLKNIMGTGLSDIDLNTLKTTGIYYCSTGISNCPVSAYCMVVVLCNSHAGSDDLVQIAMPVGKSGVIYYRRATPGWNNWETFLTDDVKQYTYHNSSIKKGGTYFYKVGRVVYFFSNGDFNASDSNVIPIGITTYINTISDDLRPISGEYQCSSWNNKGYVYLSIRGTTVEIGNYNAAMTTVTNGGFHGSYIAKY